jgi:hypothetical protein
MALEHEVSRMLEYKSLEQFTPNDLYMIELTLARLGYKVKREEHAMFCITQNGEYKFSSFELLNLLSLSNHPINIADYILPSVLNWKV